MKSDVTKYVFKEQEESNIFFVDVEDYTEARDHLRDYEDGDVVKWVWENNQYLGTLRAYGGTQTGIYIIKDAKII